MIALKRVMWIIAWEKKILPPLWKMPNQVQVLLLPATFESNGMMSHTCKLSLAAKMVIKINGGLWNCFFPANLFRIAGTSEAETLVHGKAKCLLALGEDSPSQWQKVITNASFNYCTCMQKKPKSSSLIFLSFYFYRKKIQHIMYHW